MRLLVVSSWFPLPLDNGSRIRAFHLIRHLARRHEITLLAFGAPTPDDETSARAFCRHVEPVAPRRRADAPLGLRGLLSSTPRHFVQGDSPDMHRLVTAHIGNHDAAMAMQIDAARYVAGRRGLPKVFEEAEVGVLREQFTRAAGPRSRARHGLTWWKHRRFVRRLVDDFDATTVVSPPERDHLKAIGCDGARVAVVPNGVDVEAKRPTGATRLPRLIYPGAVTYSANLDAVRVFATEMLPLVRRDRPDMQFVVTGATGDIDVSDIVAAGATFSGRLPDIDEMVARSAVCVVPLRVGGGTRLKVLEAMALGTPVVSTAKGIEGLEVEPGRHVLVADTAADFARQTLRLLGDPSLAARLAGEARQFVLDRYSWTRIGSALDDVLDAAVRRFREL